MNELAGFTPEQGRLLWQWYLTSRQQQPHIQQNYPQRRPIDEVSPHRVFVLNTEAEVIPPYACMRVTGVDVVGGQTVVKVEKPTDTDGEFLFNCQFEIPVAGESSAGVGWAYRYGVVIMQGNGTPPTAENVQYVPVVGSWEIEEGSGPFIVFGEHNVGTDTLIGRFTGSGGETQIINFQFVSYNAAPRSAIVQIEQRAFTGPVYDSYLEDSVVDVYDTDGCYLNEPSVDLTARRGKAVLVYTDDAAAALHFPDDYNPPEKYWCVISICCPNVACETV